MEAELNFEKEERSGVAVVGSYLIDAARRLGVGIEAECGRLGLCDTCAVRITGGGECLSDLTKAELEQLSEERRSAGERLSCQAKIREKGEISAATVERKKKEAPSPEEEKEKYRKQFAELPLEKKIAHLVELEAIALGETISVIVNSPFKIFDKVTDLMADFGLKLDKEAKQAVRPDEHRTETHEDPVNGDETKSNASEQPAETPSVSDDEGKNGT